MLQCIKFELFAIKCKIHALFERVFKENAGAAELVATLVIVGIVLAVALIFRTQLANMVKALWDNLVKGDNTQANQNEIVSEWG